MVLFRVYGFLEGVGVRILLLLNYFLFDFLLGCQDDIA